MKKKVYIAGPLFNQHERQYLEDIAKHLESNGLECFLPHRDLKGVEESELTTTEMRQETKDKIIAFFGGKIDVVISDMAANTTGNKSTDCIRTNYLSMEVLSFALKILKSNGSLISKVFMGDDFISVKNFAKKNFKIVKFFKPNSSKSDSKETYIQCTI